MLICINNNYNSGHFLCQPVNLHFTQTINAKLVIKKYHILVKLRVGYVDTYFVFKKSFHIIYRRVEFETNTFML